MSLWDWAVRAYARDGVQDICLSLQDDDGQSVCLLLWAAWRGSVDPDDAEAAADVARSWHRTAIDPVRAVRRTLKKPVPDMEDTRRLALREEIKRVELSAERGLLDELEAVAGEPDGRAFDVTSALASASRAWSDRVPREALKTLAGRLPQPGHADV
ncbi:TIGR02444 family protein [Brevundimonas aveniformis]|uniref:TIGR02444 family protein n=1 Tax=Brevundimonas aveniformis TaxID=370977 RepID=UPI002492E053|nr:TIGR02444 family protein [Brevundimonas aveniformis]